MRTRIDTRGLCSLVWLAELERIARCAEVLDLGAAALHKRLKVLESDLDRRLYERPRRSGGGPGRRRRCNASDGLGRAQVVRGFLLLSRRRGCPGWPRLGANQPPTLVRSTAYPARR